MAGSSYRIDNESLHNTRNDITTSKRIKEFFQKYPHSAPKECCKNLNLDYKKYGGRVRKIKHDLLKWKRCVLPVTDSQGRVHNRHVSVHRVEYCFGDPVPGGFIDSLEEKALCSRVSGQWYRSSNRNKQLEYFDDEIHIRVYPKSGTCRILPSRYMPFDDVRVKVEDVFAIVLPADVLLSDAFERMIMGLQIASRHRPFYVGPMPRFSNRFYRESLGLDIRTDGSHPGYLEVHEVWPSWIPTLFEYHRELRSAVEDGNRILSNFTSSDSSKEPIHNTFYIIPSVLFIPRIFCIIPSIRGND